MKIKKRLSTTTTSNVIQSISYLPDPYINTKLWKKLQIYSVAIGTFLKTRREIQRFGLTKIQYIKGTTKNFSLTTNTDCLIFYPKSKFIKYWDWVILSLLIYSAIFIPFFLSFPNTASSVWTLIDTVVDFVFACDIILNFNRAFYNKKSKLITKRKLIGKNYIKTWFFIDLLSCIPIQLIGDSLITNSNKYLRIFKFSRLYRIFSLVKVLRIIKVSYHAKSLWSLVDYTSFTIRFLKFCFITSFMIHTLGCGWVILSYIEDYDCNNWRIRYGSEDEDYMVVYLASVYYVFTTVSTVGYGDIVPFTNAERIYALFIMGFGIGFYSRVITDLSNLLSALDTQATIIQTKLNYFNDFAKATKLPIEIHQKIQENILLNVNKHFYSFNDLEFLKNIPFGLKEELSSYLHERLTKKIFFFNNKPSIFLNAIVPKLQKCAYAMNEIIYSIGDEAEEIYFINKGKIHFKASNEIVFRSLRQGNYFGEIEIIENTLRITTATVASNEFEVYALSKKNFFDIFSAFPEILSSYKECARLRKEKYNESIKRISALLYESNVFDYRPKDIESSLNSSVNCCSAEDMEDNVFRKDTAMVISLQHDNLQKKKNRVLWSQAVEGIPKGKIYQKAKSIKAALKSNDNLATLPTNAAQIPFRNFINHGKTQSSKEKPKIGKNWMHDEKFLDFIVSGDYKECNDLRLNNLAAQKQTMSTEDKIDKLYMTSKGLNKKQKKTRTAHQSA